MLRATYQAKCCSAIAARAGVILLLAATLAASAAGADRIILRNLTTISDRKVTAFDEDGVRFETGEPITWDEIEKGTVDPAKQAEFNKLLKELGEPLFQIRRRLKTADYEGLLAPAEEVYPRYATRKGDTAYMVTQALMWARLASGRREAAVEPYLRAFEHLRTAKVKDLNLPGDRRPSFEAETALSTELPPVWFDAKAAKDALPEVFEAVKDMADPRPEGARIYYGTLALAAGDTENAQRVLAGVKGEQPSIAELKEIAQAQQETQSGQAGPAFARLAASIDGISPQNRPVALYWLGVSKIARKEEAARREGVLELLHLPALYGKAYPELAGAGLYRAMKTLVELDDAKGASAVRKELLVRYTQTIHAAKAKSEGAAP
jgi:hypothetical protein